MNYQETVQFLYAAVPCFQNQGGGAYKPGLERVLAMSEAIGNPHLCGIKYIHIAGTNGKGSTSCSLAAVLAASGYRTGLFTSPHLVDFRERIRINGICIDEDFVIDFVEEVMPLLKAFTPSFFELTTLMAFSYFAKNQVDIAVIETGMGGRLDSTNVISPLLSIITNVSLDHTQFLGDTLVKIATEKAGIMKSHTLTVIGEAQGEIRQVFEQKAQELRAPIYFADEESVLKKVEPMNTGLSLYTEDYGQVFFQLGGKAQVYNARTILLALRLLKEKFSLNISQSAVQDGLGRVVQATGLRGRWEQIAYSPRIICDTGHNSGGIALVVEQLQNESYNVLHIVFGMVRDKDVAAVLQLLPKSAKYYFCAPESDRALPAQDLQEKAQIFDLKGEVFSSVQEAVLAAEHCAHKDDLIYIGGSNFIVAQVLGLKS